MRGSSKKIPLRAVVHGNWIAQQSGYGDKMHDRAPRAQLAERNIQDTYSELF